jgi:hypothetical protein
MGLLVVFVLFVGEESLCTCGVCAIPSLPFRNVILCWVSLRATKSGPDTNVGISTGLKCGPK